MSGLLSGIKSAIAKREEPPLQEMSASPYEFFEGPSSFTNNTGRFIVILPPDSGNVTITNRAGTIVTFSGVQPNPQGGTLTQSVEPTAPATRVTLFNGEQNLNFRLAFGHGKFLLPPGYSYAGSVFLGILCQTLDAALRIL